MKAIIPLTVFTLTTTVFSNIAHAAVLDPNSVSATYQAGVTSSYSAQTSVASPGGSCNPATIDCATDHNYNFNVSDGTNQGDLRLNPANSFTSSATPYNLVTQPTRVSMETVPIANNLFNDLTGLFYEQASATAVGQGVDPGIIELVSSSAGSDVSAISTIGTSQFINNGLESILDNRFFDNERYDVFFGNDGTQTPTPANSGFLLLERGGNDSIKIAAITSLGADDRPTAYGPLITVQTTDWVPQGFNLLTKIFGRDTGAALYSARGTNNLQELEGVLVTFADLGIIPDQTVYGYSIFGSDVDTASHDLTDPTTFPVNTTGINGLDLAYTGLFTSDNQLVLIPSPVPVLSPIALLFLILGLTGILQRQSKKLVNSARK